MNDWELTKFKHKVQFPPKVVLEKGKEYSFIPMENLDSGFKYVSPEQVKIWNGTGGAKFENGDTLFARITPCLQNGKICQVKGLSDGKGFGSTEFFIFRGIDGISDTDFIYYVAQTDEFRKYAIGSMVGASGRQRADATYVGNYELIFPPLPTQKRIASILSAYDDLIENNLKRIKLLEELAQRTYEEWFVKFRVNGEQLAMDEGTGLPVGWENVKVNILLKKIKSTPKIPSSEIVDEGSIPVIDQSRDFIAGFTNEKNSLVDEGEAIILFGDHTRIIKYINFPFARGADGTQLISSNNKRMPQILFYHSLLNIDLSNYHYARHFKYLKDSEVLLPVEEIAKDYERKCEPFFDQINIFRSQIKLLKQSRDILLPRLINGTINIES